ncbi:hypothetical protein ACLB2K_075593 [Fragaria x ananassa]
MSYDFHSPEALWPHRKPTPEHGQPQASSQRWNWPIVAGISSALNPWWNKILVTSCVIAVLFDPLFFYIPYTSEEKKCMGNDERVQTAALIFRSVTDITFLVHIIYQLYVAIKFALSRVSEDESLVFRYESVSREQMIQFTKAFSHKLSWRSFLTDVFAILPIPQIYMERATTRADEVREKIRIKKNDIDNWIENNGIEKDIKEEIMKNINEKLEKDISADLDDIYSLLRPYTRKVVKRFVGMKTLRKVTMLSKVDGRVLKMMCDYLKPVKYQEDTMVFQMGVPFDRMVFITDGSMWTYTDHQTSHSGKATSGGLVISSSMEAHFLEKGDAYGHMLLQLASSSSFKALPISVANVKCQSKVEAFVLTANDLRNIVPACGDFWPAFDYNASQDEAADQKAPAGPRKRTVATSNIHPTGYSG